MPAACVLVVDDDPDLRRLLARELGRAGYRVVEAGSGDEALLRARVHVPAVIVLDIGLPDVDGFAVLRQLKESRVTAAAAVIMLTGRGSDCDRVLGLTLGADDYVVKPFSVRELVLRVGAVGRRAPLDGAQRAGRIEIDLADFRVRVDGAPVAVTPTEFRLLSLLAGAPGRVFSHDELVPRVCIRPHPRPTRVMELHVRRLRGKLGPAAAQLETVRGVGYRLRADR